MVDNNSEQLSRGDESVSQDGVEGRVEAKVGSNAEGESTSEAKSEASSELGSEAPKFKIFLASKSPRRSQLLSEAGIDFQVLVPSTPVDESLSPDEMAMPVDAVKKLAEKKAGAAVQDLLAANPEGYFIVIGADTMVVKGGEIFGKPRNLDDAKRMLGELSGSAHDVITGVSLWMIAAPTSDDISLAYRTLAEKSTVRFKELTDDQIADYLRCGESFDKAGAYAIQGEGAKLIEGYDGALDNIIGLPVERLLKEFPDLKG